MYNKFAHDNEDEIVKLYLSGLTTRDIAPMFECKSCNTIINIVKKHGVFRDISERGKLAHSQGKYEKCRKSTIRDKEIVELYQSGLSMSEVGEMAGICYSAVQRALIRNGIARRDQSEAIGLKVKNGTHKTPWKPMEEHCNWTGGRFYNDGYVYVKMPEHPHANKKGYVAEHVLVCEQKLGRYLEKGEVVHHINAVRNDNRPENLAALFEREHNAISGRQSAERPRMRDVLQQKIRELEAENSELKKQIELLDLTEEPIMGSSVS